MSRVSLAPRDPDSHTEVIVGLDHVMGWFLQVFGREIDGEDNIIVDKDTLLTKGYNLDEIIKDIEYYAENNMKTKEVISSILMDLDPGE